MAKKRTLEQILAAARASREHAALQTENESLRSSDIRPPEQKPRSSPPLRLEPADRDYPVIEETLIFVLLTLATMALSVPALAMYWLAGPI
ncbi:hypothetical protein A7976_13565 [Methylobacillus sp. MM3]|uniref:hypothetical protein n=1 Tax=Methylobacillus sp. MM3 TaxID=1848039 RepID=UPI0007DFBBDE|nr:hypothetical protein [Methylobacillus sp. MM3]OAJ69656.1 hypothetical protein A7976_13565 [Methylobacillus sp. MM3]